MCSESTGVSRIQTKCWSTRWNFFPAALLSRKFSPRRQTCSSPRDRPTSRLRRTTKIWSLASARSLSRRNPLPLKRSASISNAWNTTEPTNGSIASLLKGTRYTGDFRKTVSELTILHQLDKENSDEYAEQAAKLYVENSRVKEALAEGIPHVIRKIAQIYLAKSEVSPDAVAVYEKVLELQPRAVGVNKMLSTVYLTRGDLDKYIAKLRLLHEIDGKNHDYLGDLAQCVIDNDLIDETIREGNRGAQYQDLAAIN